MKKKLAPKVKLVRSYTILHFRPTLIFTYFEVSRPGIIVVRGSVRSMRSVERLCVVRLFRMGPNVLL